MKLRQEILAILTIAISACVLAPGLCAQDSPPEGWKSGFVTTTDGVKIHYVEAGHVTTTGDFAIGSGSPPGISAGGSLSVSHVHQSPAILFVPGWVMPEWIWDNQIAFFSKSHHVVAMDPRSQGESSRTSEGLYPAQMARDIQSVIDQLHLAPVVIVGWSMAVVETLAYVDQFGTKTVAGLVLVDELAGGQEPGDADMEITILKGVLADRKNAADYFVRKVQFHKPQPEDYIQRVIAASLTVPTSDAVALLAGRYSADYRQVLSRIDRPTLVCAARSPFFDRVVAMQQKIPGSKLEIFEGAGHALFVDNPEQFNTALQSFVAGIK